MVFVRQIFGEKLNARSFIVCCLLYPFFIRGLYWIRQSMEPFYMNSTCLMDLVRVSAPEHYDVHPLWPHFQKATNETCESLTGSSIDQYFLDIYANGKTEFFIMYGIFFSYAIFGFLSFLQSLVKGEVKNLIAVIFSLFLAWNQGSLQFLLAHYQNDCTHLNGNVMHHSNYSVDGDNATGVNTLPPGLLINFLCNYMAVEMMFYVALDYLKLDKKLYFNLSAPTILGKFILQMKVVHPYVHTYGKSWYKATFGEWFPINDIIHVTCHHVNGYCLGDGPQYMWFYDAMLYWHGQIYSNGHIVFKSIEHYLFNFAIDYTLLFATFIFSFLSILVLYPFLQRQPQPKSKVG